MTFAVGRSRVLLQGHLARAFGRTKPITRSPARLIASQAAPDFSNIGVAAALRHSNTDQPPSTTLFTKQFSLEDRVGLVTGAHRGIGLELALALVEAGARAVYCVDLPDKPNAKWEKVREYAANLTDKRGEGRLEYVSADVRDQEGMHKIGRDIGDKEGRLDVCVPAAGIVEPGTDCLNYTAELFRRTQEINFQGSFFTAQAAAKQMIRFGSGGSIVFIASGAAHAAVKGLPIASYNSSKAAVAQLTRTMACELAPQGIRVNSISPGFVRTDMTVDFIEWGGEQNPMGRVAYPSELRGVAAWLASDASSFCTGSDVLVTGGHHAW